jgi:hypothetical protein
MMRWISLMVAAMVTAGLWAQEEKVQDPARSKELNTEADVELLREDVQAKRQEVIKEGMQLDEKQAASFWPAYEQYAGAVGRPEAGHHSRLCQEFHDHGRCEGRRTGATGDGAGRAANGIAKEILPSHEEGAAYGVCVAILPTDNQVQMLIDDLQIASDLLIIEEAPAKRVKQAESE